MASEWQKITLEKAGILLLDCVHKTPPSETQGIPYIAIPQLKEGRIDFSANPRLISHKNYLEWTKKAKPQVNDIVLSRRCNPGETAYVPKGAQFALGQNLVLLRSEGSQVYPPFFRWVVRGSEWWDEIAKYLNVGAIFDSLRCAEILKFEVTIPSFSEQKAIAHILGSLDDKIELNRQMNVTLEAMAQALFKSWFVDFDPVIDNALAVGNSIPDELEAKAAAREALGDARKSLPEDMRSLFPNAFVFTEEMGWIPEGWEISSLKDVSLVKGGYAFKSKDFTFSGSPVIKIKNINSDRTVDINDVQYIPDSIANKAKSFWLHTGDLLMAMTGATVGKFGLLTTIKDEHYLLNQRVAKFFPLTNLSKKIWFVYCCLNQEITTDYITNIAHGSAQPNISGDAIMTAKIIFPTSNLIRLFDENVDSIFSKMLKNNQQAYSLIQLRDTLLPKLLSGELRIPEAERLVEESVA